MRAFRASIRVTRRDALRHPLMSLLAVLIVAIPTAMLSYFLVREESRATAYELSFAPTTATYIGGQCRQSPDGYSHECSKAADERPQQEILLDVLPHGFTAELVVSGPATLESPGAVSQTSLTQVDPGVPQAPSPGDIRLTTPQREQLGVAQGDTVTVTAEGTTVEVTVSSDTPGTDALLSHPTVIDPATFRTSPALWAVWHLEGTRALTWDDVEKLNGVGFTVQSPEILGAPPPSAAGLDGRSPGLVDPPLEFLWTLMTLVSGVVVALLVVQLFSPVFAISVNRQSRTFALMSAQGAAPRHIIWAALTYGALAGLIGATVGVLFGAAAAYVLWLRQYPDWPVEIPWIGLPAVWATAVAASTAATLLPAWLAARADAFSGVPEAASGRMLRRQRWVWTGPGLLVASLILLGVSLLSPPPPNFEDLNWASLASTLGGLTGFIGVAFTAPAVVRLIGLQVSRPLPARLAARDMVRQPLRSMPAVAAIAALVTLSTFFMVQSESFDDRATAWERQTYRPGVIAVPDSPRLEETISAISDVVGPLTRVEVHGISYDWSSPRYAFLVAEPELVEPCNAGEPCGPPVWVPGPQSLFDAPVVIASPLLLDALSVPATMPSGAAMLVSGDVEVEEATFRLQSEVKEPFGDTENVGNKVTLRISPILPETVTDWMPTPEAFEQFGVGSEFLGEMVIAERPITTQMRTELSGIDANIRIPGVPPERESAPQFYVTGIVIFIVTLVLLVSVGQMRQRNALLESIGAPPHLSRAVTASAGALITLSGSVLGLIAGHAGALFTSQSLIRYVSVDWWLILGLVVIAPLSAALIGWAITPGTVLPDHLPE
ncbi:FtsX-like permease family protein [Corynebacterium comes]|uniref:FtsX-like permease family protein n=1 Tax=Corynebacterium comes TaxID=2675218 RepID=A0A6B8VLT2_9CORY|nr:FtsX-like permease family protein [Corynebacterium comes]QGU04019.1 FtsX-like permease family protein [Corynebacterium comes]